MVDKVQNATTLGISPDEERRLRMVRYSIAMSVRVVCVILAVVVQGPLMWVCFAGAIFLPYFAVVIANAAGNGASKKNPPVVESPLLRIDAAAFREAPSNDTDGRTD